MSDVLCYSGAFAAREALGTPHYSYRFAEEKFLACFAAMGIGHHYLAMPEYYGTSRALETLPTFKGRHVHVIFRSTEQVRVLKNAFNILCFAWEFPHLKETAADGEHPFTNQKRMLSLCDELWVPCNFTKAVLERHGIANVHRIPAPIATSVVERFDKSDAIRRIGHVDGKTMEINFLGQHGRRGDRYVPLFQSLKAESRNIYLSVFNPEDFRKNFDAMVRGFDAFQQRHHEAVLVIKALTSRDRFTLERIVLDVMANKLTSGSSFANNNIIVISQFLDDEDMAALYDLADFYLCTSIAEGQNLPLLEAMSRGVVPVTTRNTAMLDYIDESNAVIIDANVVRNTNPHLAGNIAGKNYDVDLSTARQVGAALHVSSTLEPTHYRALSQAAIATVERCFSIKAVSSIVAERLLSMASP